GYAVYALLAHPGALPAGELMAWLQGSIWILPVGLLLSWLPLLFPNGQFLSPRWRFVASGAGIFFVLAWLFYVMIPGPMQNFSTLDNPFGIEGAATTLNVGLFSSLALGFATIVASWFSLYLRVRRSSEIEREQIKWLLYALALAILVAPISSADSSLAPLLIAAFFAVPIAVGIAILRYRLYDIDVIIRRTLIYSILTASLTLVYFASILILQQLARTLTGQQQSEIVTVVSTLAIAAVFVPLRNHIQNRIDHRFYRRKYDAQQILAEFSASIRDEVELRQLREDMLRVVNETMQPAHVSLWLTPTEERTQGAHEQL
ncbi:MAG: hypothetical protein LC737_04075, partial [Chloroflexi bacterium]|nr:hypothetical protein [Chloroflexota bacterium]